MNCDDSNVLNVCKEIKQISESVNKHPTVDLDSVNETTFINDSIVRNAEMCSSDKTASNDPPVGSIKFVVGSLSTADDRDYTMMSGERDTTNLADLIAAESLRQYALLPAKALPQKTGRQWALLAAVVMTTSSPTDGATLDCRTVALATGSKCLPANRLRETGDLVSDEHAEVLARRSLRRFLLAELRAAWSSEEHSRVFLPARAGEHQVHVRANVHFHLYCSHTPCGDASIIPKRGASPELSSEAKRQRSDAELAVNKEDDVHRTGAKTVSGEPTDLQCAGSEYHTAGALRTKPGRGERTLSHCCSDKIAKWLVLGVQGALLSHFISAPLQLTSIVIGADCPFSESVMRRALVERTAALHNSTTSQPLLLRSSQTFCHSRRAISLAASRTEDAYSLTAAAAELHSEKVTTVCPCPRAGVWTAATRKTEQHLQVLVDGVLNGSTRKQRANGSARAVVCRAAWASELCKFAVEDVGRDNLPEALQRVLLLPRDSRTYAALKATATDYQHRWRQLRELCFKNWTQKPHKMKEFIVDVP